MKAVRTLVVGTTGGEFTVSADGTDASITPTNITIKRQSSFGSANVDAIPAGNDVNDFCDYIVSEAYRELITKLNISHLLFK